MPCFQRAIQTRAAIAASAQETRRDARHARSGPRGGRGVRGVFRAGCRQGQGCAGARPPARGRKAEAIEALRGALRESPDNVDAMRYLAQIYIQDKERLSDAEALLRRATSLAPDYAAAWMLLGAFCTSSGGTRIDQSFSRRRPRSSRAMPPPGPASATHCVSRATSKAVTRHMRERFPWTRERPAPRWGSATCSRRSAISPALGAYRAAIAAKPEFGEVYWSMANSRCSASRTPKLPPWKSSRKGAISRQRRDPFPLRAREGVGGQGRLRSRLAFTTTPVTRSSASRYSTTRHDVEHAARADRRSLRP